nr:MAG: RNA-dependent RNA polymerase [Huangpi Tick Virus 1]
MASNIFHIAGDYSQSLRPTAYEVKEGHYEVEIVVNLKQSFRLHNVPSDGDCFFRCAALHLLKSEAEVSRMKNIILSYALNNWDSLPELREYYSESAEYIRDFNSPGYWGGSIEAEIINHAFGVPVVLWHTSDWTMTVAAKFWLRRHGPEPELNLVYQGSHFQYLEHKSEEKPSRVIPASIEEAGPTFTDKEEESEVVDILEDVFLPEHERLRIDLLHGTSERKKPSLSPALSRQLEKLQEQEKTLPFRVGRFMSRLFPCSVKVQMLEQNTYQLVPQQAEGRDILSLTDLGHLWMKAQKKVQRPPKVSLIVSDELAAFVDKQFVLSTLLGPTMLAGHSSVVPDELIAKVASTAAVVLMSSFFYKSSMKFKAEFILENLPLSDVPSTRAKKYVHSLRPFSVYHQPLETAQTLVLICFQEVCQRISLSISRLPSAAYLLLSCIDVASLSIKTFEELLEILKEPDFEERAISNSEVQEIVNTCVRLEKIFELKMNGSDRIEYRDLLARFGLEADKHIHKTASVYWKSQELVLKDFFEKRMVMKLMSKKGKAYTGHSITSLLAYISNILFMKEKLGLSQEELAVLDSVEKRLVAIQSRDNKVPVPILCKMVEQPMFELFNELPESCSQECKMLFSRVRNSDTHSTAWSAALRLKGVAYEGFFSKSYNIKYIPEDQKPTLSMAIQTYYPEKFDLFLQRTQLHPEIREFRPDFLLAKRHVYDPNSELPRSDILEQVSDDIIESADSSPLTRKTNKVRAFPLPEVPIDEPFSFEKIGDSLLKQVKLREKSGAFLANSTLPPIDKKTEFLIIEVGFQTDTEGKVYTDLTKWKSAVSLMDELNIRSTVIACSDCSSNKSSDWYVPERYVKLLKNSISNLFSKLNQNSPPEVTDIMIGAISTQKVRAVLKAGSSVKTPVTLKDLLVTWKDNKNYITQRPTGLELPVRIEHMMTKAFCEGVTVTKDSARKVIDEVISQKEVIADWVESTKYACEVNEPIVSSCKLILGWLLDDLESCRCSPCFKKVKTTISKTDSIQEKLIYVARQIQLESHEECCHKLPLKKKDKVMWKSKTPVPSLFGHLETEISDGEGRATTLDKLCRLTLPGKTEKERRIKRAVEQLLRETMYQSNIPCIKLPTGQIIVNTDLFQNSSRTKGKVHKEEEGSSRIDRLKAILSPDKLFGYSENIKTTLSDALKGISRQQGSLCEMRPDWVRKVLSDLDADLSEADLLLRMEHTRSEKLNFTINNDKLVAMSNEEVLTYLLDCSEGLLNLRTAKPVFRLDCLLHKEIYLECARRYQNTPYHDCMATVCELIKLFLSFQWFQELVTYSKICETFLQCCTEFNRSGIKVRRVRHCSLNLAICLPSNKKENMKCAVYDSDFTLLTNGLFMLNRRVAVLGAAMPYIVIICALQCIQHSRCVDQVHMVNEALVTDILTRNAKTLDLLQSVLPKVNNGCFEEAGRKFIDYCTMSGNYLTRSSRDTFVCTVSGISVMFSCLLGSAMLLNSQPFNKQIQNMRFGMLFGLSRISCPTELGKKLSSSCRHVETYIARLYLQLVTFCSGIDPETNIENWKKYDLCPKTTIPSLTLTGCLVSGDRQLIFDIYLVHIYNKEMDNFDEGCIKVLQETLERHISWEVSLLESAQNYKNGKQSDRLKEMRTMRLLLGLPNIKPGDVVPEIYSEDDSKSSASSTSSSHSIGKTRSFSSGKRFKSVYGRLRSTIKPFSADLGLEAIRDEMSDFNLAIVDSGTGMKYEPNPESVMKDIKQVVKCNPSHTFGSFDLIQCMVEIARQKFPPESIAKAQRDQTNWQGVSAYTETTSSIAEPRTRIILKDALKVITSGETKKSVKLIRNRLRKINGGANPRPERISELIKMLDTVETFTEQQREDIKRGLAEPSRLSFFPWKEIVSRSIRDVLITNDANMIYCWLKSLAANIKKHLKPYIPHLRYGKQTTIRDSSRLKALLGDTYPAVKALMDFFSDAANNVDTSEHVMPPYTDVFDAWIKFIDATPSVKEIVMSSWQSTLDMLDDFGILICHYVELVDKKKKYPDLSFIREEIEVKDREQQFLQKYDSNIMEFINMIFAVSLCCPWCIHYKSFELLISQCNAPFSPESDNSEHIEFLKNIGPLNLFRYKWPTSYSMKDIPQDHWHNMEMLYRYCCAMFSSNEEPITAILNLKKEAITHHAEEQALSMTRALLAKYGLESTDLDFKWTLNLIANSNFEVTKRITGRTEGEKLPRSVRSKVIYEMIKLVKNTGMAILQQHAFSYILNSGHRFFAVLAPKAQLGGHRDLLVQEIMTKIIHAASETFSRALLATTQDDGLTNQHLKESILQYAFEQMQLSNSSHGGSTSESHTSVRFFCKTFAISGDRTKWGPIHCTSFFSGMMQQLLQDCPDWCSFMKLVMLKNLYRQVEIPSGAVKKIINAFKLHTEGKYHLEEMTEDSLRRLLLEHSDIWKDNHMIQFLVQVYLSKGKLALDCYNHMGQGIHHATSSVLTSCMAVLVEDVIISYFLVHMPELTTTVKHAGSSDDYAKVVTVAGHLPESLFERYDKSFWKHVCRLQNSMNGISRACQMKDSAKTLIGDVMCEFYSEFMLFHRVTPAVIKFILTGLINSSVTSPQSMVQACQVSAQQAMYNSVPLMTNICFTVFRQQMFANHTELFQRKYGPLVHGLPSAFGRLYLPTFSNLTTSAIAIEDAESISCDMETLVELSSSLRSTPEPNYDHLELRSPEVSDNSLDSSPEISSEAGGTASVSSASTSSFKFSETKRLTSTEMEYLKASSRTSTISSENQVLQHVEQVYSGHSDYDGWPCLEKLRNSPLVVDSSELKKLYEECPLRLIRYVKSIICGLVVGYYRSFASEGTEKTLKANLNRDENRIIEDPMIQLLPEKLRRELHRLGVAREEYDGYSDGATNLLPLVDQVARRVVTMNCLTEDFEAEADRLKQTLSSRNIIHGLAGGIKELSLPLYTIFLKSYFFIDKVFLSHADRWNTKHSRNYKDSTGKSLDGKVVTKYMVWLDAVLGSLATRNNRKLIEPSSLLNSSLKCIELLTFEGGTRVLSLVVEDIRFVKDELRALAVQFSDSNRMKMKVLESSRPEYEREANKVVISKSGLFSAGEQIKIRNNPALVIGCLLNKEIVIEIKPSKLDLSSLLIDVMKMKQFYTSISEVCDRICEESKSHEKLGEVPRQDEVNGFANTLTLLSRLAQKSNTRIVSFHMIKPMSAHTESTVSDLISYGTKEGRNIILSDIPIETGTTSLKYWRILQCISSIGNFSLSDDEKTNLLTGFMNWVPRLSMLDTNCPVYKYEETVLEEFKDRSLVNSLMAEIPNIKKESERKQVECLVDFVQEPMILVTKKPFFGKTVDFNTRGGDTHRTGNFTLSSSAGEAAGIFVNGSLHIYLSRDSNILLTEVESHVLYWQNKMRTDVLTREQHNDFIDFLPTYGSLPRKLAEGAVRGVKIDEQTPRMLKLVHPKTHDRVVKVKPHILTVRKSSDDTRVNEPRLIWGKGSVSVVYDEYTTETTYHEAILSIRRKLDLALESVQDQSIPSKFYSDMKVVLGKIKYQQEANNASLALLHCYLSHSAEHARLELHTKTQMIEDLLGINTSLELNVLQKLRNFTRDQKKPLRDSTEQLITVASKITESLNNEQLPLSYLPEVQQFLDETGNSAITVEADMCGLQNSLKWKCTVETIGFLKPTGDLRSIVNTIGGESMPLQLAQFSVNPLDWKQLVTIGKEAQQQLVSSRTTDKVMDALFCISLYCCQGQPLVRSGYRCLPSSLLPLVHKPYFEVKGVGQVGFVAVDDDTVELKVSIKVPAVKKTDRKAIRALTNASIVGNNLLSEQTRTYEQIKNDLMLSLTHEGQFSILSYRYDSTKARETTVDRLFVTLANSTEETMRSLKGICNLACFLMGVQSPLCDMTSDTEESLDLEELATLDDLMSEGFQDEGLSDQEELVTDYDFGF